MTLAFDRIFETDIKAKLSSISPQNKIVNNLNAQLQNTLDRSVKNNLISGQTIGIVSSLGTWFGASGFANWLPRKTMLTNNLLPIGTLTKAFTAITVLQLATEGSLGLEDSLEIWLDENILALIPNANKITIRQLLHNSSGIVKQRNYCQKYSDRACNLDKIYTCEEVITAICDKYSLENIPNFEIEELCYLNLDYILAGIIIEQATDNTIANEFQKRIIQPLGLENTFYCNNFDRIACGYDRKGQDISKFNSTQLSALATAGAIVSNIKDLTKFSRSLLDNKLIPSQQIKEFEQIKSSGLGFINKKIVGENASGYCSNLLGYNAQIWHFIEQNITIVSLQNNSYLEAIAKPYYLGSEGPIADLYSVIQNQIDNNFTSQSNLILSLILRSAMLNNSESIAKFSD